MAAISAISAILQRRLLLPLADLCQVSKPPKWLEEYQTLSLVKGRGLQVTNQAVVHLGIYGNSIHKSEFLYCSGGIQVAIKMGCSFNATWIEDDNDFQRNCSMAGLKCIIRLLGKYASLETSLSLVV